MKRTLVLFCFFNSILSDTIPEMVKRMKTELAMESDLRLKKDQKQGGLIQKLLKEVKHLKGRNHILESQFRNFVQEEQMHEAKQRKYFKKQIARIMQTQFNALQASQYARDEVGEIRRRLRMRTAIRNSKEKSPLSPSLNDPAYSTVAKPLLNASDMTQMRASVPRPNSNLRSSQNRPLFNRSARSHWMKNMKQRNQVTKARQAINN